MRELRHISKKQLKKRQFNKGIILVGILGFFIILAGAFAYLRPGVKRVSVDLTPGNIYSDNKAQNQQRSPEEDSNSVAMASGQDASAKNDNFTFYKVLNSKEGDIIPLNVQPSKSVPQIEQYAEPRQDEKMERIDSEIVKKIESRDKEDMIYTIQIGALRQEKAANELASNIRSKGFAPYITKENSSGTPPVYKVMIGKFLSMVDAQEVAAVLKREGYATYVLKISGNE